MEKLNNIKKEIDQMSKKELLETLVYFPKEQRKIKSQIKKLEKEYELNKEIRNYINDKLTEKNKT